MSKQAEIEAMSAIAQKLEALENPVARQRVVDWVAGAYGVTPPAGSRVGHSRRGSEPVERAVDLGRLVEQANPQTQEDRALVIAYWLQATQGSETFDSKSVNDQLKNLGHPESHIAQLFTRLMDRSPQLVRQTQKAGKTRQARKKYRVTDAGRRYVEELMRDASKANE